MPFCYNCGKQFNEGAKFCSGCGYNVGKTEDDTQRQQEWAGKLIKCPSCGEDIPSFTGICPSCGHEFREIKANMTVKELSYKLENAITDTQKADIIRNFPIPNTKEDILEFMIMASTNIENTTQSEVSESWLVKFEQAYEKAKILFEDTSEFDRIYNLYIRKKENRLISSVKELSIKLNQIDKEDTNSTFDIIYASLSGISKKDEKKINIIKNYSIPDSKIEMLEFMRLAYANIDFGTYGMGDGTAITPSRKRLSEVWRSKMELTWNKAKSQYSGSDEFCQIDEIHKEINQIIIKRKKGLFSMIFIVILILVILLGTLILLSVVEENKSEKLVVYTDIYSSEDFC